MPASLSQTCEPKEDTRYEHHCCSLIWPSSMEKNHILFKFGVENLKRRYVKKKNNHNVCGSKYEGCLEIIETSTLTP